MKQTSKFFTPALKSGHTGGKNKRNRPTKQRPMSRALIALATVALLATATPAIADDAKTESPTIAAKTTAQPTQNFEQLFDKAVLKSEQKAKTAAATDKKDISGKKDKPWYFWLIMAGILSIPYGHYKMGMAMIANDKRKEEEKKKKAAEETARKAKIEKDLKDLRDNKNIPPEDPKP